MKSRQFVYSTSLLIVSFVTAISNISIAKAVQPIVFPVIGQSSYSNDYSAPRSNGPHRATDIIANKHQKIVAAMGGTITFVGYPQPSWGYAVFIDGDDGYSYNYLHINNDTPGTDDGLGGPLHAYAPDIRRGNKIVKGQLIGWVGDSGNAENTVPHLHFEMEDPSGNKVNPYLSLRSAKRLSTQVDYPALPGEVLPYGSQARIRVNVAMGNIDGDVDQEVATGAGPGGTSPQVKLFNRDGSVIRAFNAYHSAGYKSGADVAAGDVDGDGADEIITGTGAGASPSVKVFKQDGSEIGNFLAYEEGVKSGLSVAAGDVDGDGADEIITVLRAGSNSNIKVFKLSDYVVSLHSSFLAYHPTFVGGADITAGDVSGDTKDEIITIPISNGGPDVRVYDQSGLQLNQFFAYDTTYRRGSRISAGNVRTNSVKSEILVVPVEATAHSKMFNGAGNLIAERWFVEEWWRSTFDVAAGYDQSIGSTGVNRRTSVKTIE